MAEGVDKTLDLADKWAAAVGDKLQQMTPDVAEATMQAVKITALSRAINWPILLISFLAVAWLSSKCWKICSIKTADERAYRRDEEIPWFVGGIVTGFCTVVLGLAVCLSFPAKEIAGIYYPKGYAALVILEKLQK